MRLPRPLPRLLPLGLLLAFGVSSCGDAEPLLFPAPASFELTRNPSTEGRVGDPVERAPQIRVRDTSGAPRPGIRVEFQVTEGGGSVNPSEAITNDQGIANVSSWTLGTVPGRNVLEARIEGLSPTTFEAQAAPNAPVDVRLVTELQETEAVGADLEGRIRLEFRDRYENMVPGVPVSAEIIEGEGTLTHGAALSGEDGRWTLPRWTLGPTPGEQRLRLTYGTGVPSTRVVAVQTVAAAPHTVAVIEGDAQVAPPGSEVEVLPAVRVEDRFRNLVAGVQVNFSVTAGGGSVTGAGPLTDGEGVARVGSWRLGPQPGMNRLTATVAGVDPVNILAEGAEGTARIITLASTLPLESAAGYPVPEAPRFRIIDGNGDPVAGAIATFQVVEGGGTVSPASASTNAEGFVQLDEWRLGPAAGANRLQIQVSGAAGVTVEVAGKIVLVVKTDRVVLNQGNQTPAGTIPGVAHRGGVIRVLGRATLQNNVSPDARITLFHGNTPVLSQVVSLAAGGIPQNPDGSNPNVTWNLPVPANLVRPDLGVRVEIDPGGAMDVPDRNELVFPSPGGIHPMGVQTVPTFRATFIPVNSTELNSTGRINTGNINQFMEFTLRTWPIGEHDVTLRETFVTNEGPMTGSDAQTGWSRILQQLQQLRVLEAPDRYYHGIIHRVQNFGPAGLAYVPPNPQSVFRSALSWDDLPGASATVAHEFGHNFGRLHAPCGNPSGVDPAYPYAGATLGAPGWDNLNQGFASAGANRDLMSYCTPRWVSDFNYGAVFNFRAASFMGAPAMLAAASAGAPTYGILLWGEWNRDGGTLNPAFRAEAHPTPTPSRVDAEVLGLDGEGGVLFRVPVEGAPVDHAEDPTLRHFSTFVPLSAEMDRNLHTLVLRGGFGEDRLLGAGRAPVTPTRDGPAGVPAVGRQELRVESDAGPSQLRKDPAQVPSRTELRWDGTRYPMALIRNEEGVIVGMARQGRLPLPPEWAGRELEVQLTDGVHVKIERVR